MGAVVKKYSELALANTFLQFEYYPLRDENVEKKAKKRARIEIQPSFNPIFYEKPFI